MSAPRIVILGGGFAGAYCAQALEKAARRGRARVLLIDRNNYFIFYPLLVEAGTGSLEPRHAVVPLRSFLKRTSFRMTEAVEVDFGRREIRCRAPGGAAETIPYDHLVLCPGSVTRLPNVPGLEQHAFEMKSLADAVALRDRAVGMLELADAEPDPERRQALLHFVVVGANFTGVEVAGELEVFLRHGRRLYHNVRREDCRITLVEITDRILPALDRKLADYAASRLTRRRVRLLLHASVARIDADKALLSGGESLAAHTVIWCAGIQPPPLVKRLHVPVDARGYVLCERDMRVRGYENVWCIGDCAVIPDASGRPYPPTAQHAVREGTRLARNLARALVGKPTRPFDFSALGSLAPLGCRTAVANVFGINLSGFPAYVLWRSYYWLRMPGLARKIRVAMDWTADLLFTRDFVQLGLHRGRRHTAD
ncbi:MAG TPA: NAD(P)/FAD-dependent oxidoreductase [Candidatus Polarisedimenticolia bacterium]|jgi:NADH dehydrogenase|nr:NAD(P)/FAD-dependent oxidoreductase [Candidatus Polarisedimenticolia bacterium]